MSLINSPYTTLQTSHFSEDFKNTFDAVLGIAGHTADSQNMPGHNSRSRQRSASFSYNNAPPADSFSMESQQFSQQATMIYLKNLEEQVEDLTRDNRRLATNNSFLRRENASVVKARNEAEDKLLTLGEENGLLKDEVYDLKSDLYDLEKELSKQDKIIEEYRRDYDAIDYDKSRLEEEISRVQNHYERIVEKIQSRLEKSEEALALSANEFWNKKHRLENKIKRLKKRLQE